MIIIYFSFIATLLTISGCSTPEVKQKPDTHAGTEVVSNQITISPSRSFEECMELRPGRVMSYSFSSDKPVEFNVHYHAEGGIQYPVLEKGTVKSDGAIDPEGHHYYTKEQEFYCLMWENNGSEPVNISFTCTLTYK